MKTILTEWGEMPLNDWREMKLRDAERNARDARWLFKFHWAIALMWTFVVGLAFGASVFLMMNGHVAGLSLMPCSAMSALIVWQNIQFAYSFRAHHMLRRQKIVDEVAATMARLK